MTYADWATSRRHAEHGAKLDRDPKGYFEAVDLLHRLEGVLCERK